MQRLRRDIGVHRPLIALPDVRYGPVAASRRGQLSAAAGRGYGVTVEAVCKRWSARMQMLGQEECNRVVKSVQLRS